ncbi:MAG TPA: hypothetical protein VJK72_03685 [Candidatus Nanoarchaeia archaeon]|nr:hypothetical protein [Candidatus Nanoarchaeia archaeon]
MQKSTETILRIYLCCFVLAAFLLIPTSNVWNSITGLAVSNLPASSFEILMIGVLGVVAVAWGYARIHKR